MLYQKIKSGDTLSQIEEIVSDFDSENSDKAEKDLERPLRILSNIECTYFANLIKKKLERKEKVKEDFSELGRQSLLTLRALMKLLLLKS